MTSRVIENEQDLNSLLLLIGEQKMPFTIALTAGRKRSVEQNRLQRMWLNEISEQLGDRTPEEVRGYCKLTIGVPILRAENDFFQEKYDSILKPLSYEQKLAVMTEPLDLPITRIMTTKQKTKYLDEVVRHFSEKGIVLTQPENRQAA